MSIQETKFKAIADAIRAKTGETGTIVANDFATKIAAIPTGGSTNYRHYEYDNPAAVSGNGNYITVVSGDETLKRVRSLDTLLVVCRMPGTVSCVKSCLGTNVLKTYPIYNFATVYQSVLRYNKDGVINANNTVNAVDDDTNITAGSGRIYITPEGDLRIYGNTNSYPILAGKVMVEVIW